MFDVDLLILGAGIAGLGASLKAKEEDVNAVIFESSNSAGGLLDNFEVQGFRFDNAVHLSFATENEVRKLFDKIPYYSHLPDSWNYENGNRLKHPVQNNLYPLPAVEKLELIKSFLSRPNLTEDNYENWLRHQYGDKISERFPLIYTNKYWCTPASNLSTSWIGNRMRRAEFDEILFGSLTSETPNTYYTKEMRYPKKGGFKSFITSLIDNSVIKFNHRAEELNLDLKTVRFSNGLTVKYNKLISSIPLPELVNITISTSKELEVASKSLAATSIDLISLGFNRQLISDLWFYIYDQDILASRAHSPSVKSADNAPFGCSSLQFEIYSRGTKSRYTKEELFDNTLYALKKYNIASPSDIIFMNHKHLKYGNVIFDLGMEKNRDYIREYYSKNEIQTVGRFGEWDYLWSNQSFLSGYHVKL
jgi:protoporphyrinogen oxidase